MSKKIKTAVLGATGVVGQVFLWMLSKHQWFEVDAVVASQQRVGCIYGDTVKWLLPIPMPDFLKEKQIDSLDPQLLEDKEIRIIFSALPADIAGDVEPELRQRGFYLFSNASALRYEENVPILIPEVNPLEMNRIECQGYPDGGFVITNANCATTGLAVAMAPLRKFGILEIHVSTYQSMSGAGYPGLSALDISGNLLPFIKLEEEKMIKELKKILNINADIFPYCVRVPVLFGHLETIWVKFKRSVRINEIREAWESFQLENIRLPSSPDRPVIYDDREDFPQTRICFHGRPPGMPVFVGRLQKRADRIGFVLLVNNLVKGAAGGSVQNAELFVQRHGEKL